MTHNIFNNNLAEISISYSSKIPVAERRSIRSSRDAADAFRQVWPGFEHREYFYMLCLNRANQVLGFHQVSVGGIAGTVTDAKIVFQVALKANASAIIVAHNHPSGNTSPSEADKKITKRLKDAGTFLDIQVLDHLILTEESYKSFADDSLM